MAHWNWLRRLSFCPCAYCGPSDQIDRLIKESSSEIEALVRLLGLRLSWSPLEALVQRLASLKTRLQCMPVCDLRLAHLPAEQNHLLIDLAGKIEQPNVEVLYLHADRVDLFHGILGALDVRVQLGALPPDFADVDMHAAGDENALGQPLQFVVNLLGSLLGLDRALQQRLQHWN